MMAVPRMLHVEQDFPKLRLNDIRETLQRQFARKEIGNRIASGMNVAIAVGSRGISRLEEIVVAVVAEVRRRGAAPFIVPAMGSHGGATAEGQTEVLASLGITEQAVGAPIVSSMETVEASRTDDGIPLYFDKHAYEADAIIIIARVKPHTDFKGPYESGLMKMLAIGLGKHKGAAMLHSQGFDRFAELIPHAGKKLIASTPVALGVAVVENAYEDVARLEVVPSDQFAEREPALLSEAKKLMPRLLVDAIDVLIIDEIGKDISGAGMDPNITGRFPIPLKEAVSAPAIQKIVVRDLSERTNGNATGIGMADITTRRLVGKIDFRATYTNCITSTVLAGAKIPLTAESDREALEIAIRTCNRIRPERVKIAWIKNTLHLHHILLSETYFADAAPGEGLRAVGDPFSVSFDREGNLMSPFS